MKIYFEDVYENIGNLFYALASEHGKLNKVTFDKLKRLVDQQWYPAGKEMTLESHLLQCLHSALEKAFNASKDPEQAFLHFKNYFTIHSEPFGQALRSRIFATSNTIASEFSGNGKKSDFLKGLEKLLDVSPIAH